MPRSRADIANALGCSMIHNANSSEVRRKQPCCMRGLKPSPAPVYLGAAFLLVKGQGEMNCGWWQELPPCTSFHLHRVRWGWTGWTSMTVRPEQWLLVNLRRLVCRFFSNYAGRDKCIGVIEAGTVLWQSLCWPSHYITKRWEQVCMLAIV